MVWVEVYKNIGCTKIWGGIEEGGRTGNGEDAMCSDGENQRTGRTRAIWGKC